MNINLSLRLLWRDTRSGELSLLLIALILAVACTSAITLFSERLERSMQKQTAEFIAADLAIASPDEIPDAWQAKAEQLGLQLAHTLDFTSVIVHNDDMLLASVKAVTEKYPLRGALKTIITDYHAEQIENHGPAPGKAWVDERVLSALHIKLSDNITVGELALSVEKIITYEPDRQVGFFSMSPRVLINNSDLPATHILQPGSHVHYFFQFSGSESALNSFKTWLKPQLTPSQRLLDIEQDRPEVGSALSRAERYVSLAGLLVIIIAGVAIAMSASRYAERHFDNVALLRCFGCSQNAILGLFISQLISLGLIACSLGIGLGWLTQHVLFLLLQDILPKPLADTDLTVASYGFVIGFLLLIGFGVAPLTRLRHVSPLRVLRRDLAPMPTNTWISIGLSLIIISLLLWHYTQDLRMTAIILGVGSVSVSLLSALIFLILRATQQVSAHTPLIWRLTLRSLLQQPTATLSQIMAFAISLSAMSLCYSIGNDLLKNWQQQLPTQAPNHFALNIFPEQLSTFQQLLNQQQLTSSRFYPVVRGRIISINEQPVQRFVRKDSAGENATHRELNLTWSNELPEDNQINQGQWWSSVKPGLVSVEQKLADSLSITLGDQLEFTIGSEHIKAEVASIRSLRWDSMKPNFLMIFSPGTLNEQPHTFITSFYLPDDQKNVLNQIMQSFPNATLLDVAPLLTQFKTIVLQLSQALNFILYFALAAGFTVMFAALQTSLDARKQTGAIMRTFGASRKLLVTSQRLEFALLGAIAGLIAVTLSEILLYALYTQLLDLSYHINLVLALSVPTLASVLLSFTGSWSLRRVVNQAPLKVLREQ
ncbi:ABC transporter permease [Methylocucumis oryzae]|uniref:ABC transporter permease n=1 Tax=Methylocucumis oryzae TaxID=1632867 RepID=A0A0F3INR0_9GAMM|nr:FtsX-like permease family protein [Methylocucumis oryzae]KJV07209.1 ABC transporter permease [Methylocucumis oryzae]